MSLLIRQVGPRHVETDTAFAGGALQIRQLRAIVRLAPGFNRSLVDRLRWIGHHEPHVELDDIAEAVARWTCPERIVEREQTWLRRLVGDAARPALEPFRELEALARVRIQGKRGAAALAVRRLDRVRQAAAQVPFDAKAIDDDFEPRARLERGGIDLLEHNGAARLVRTASDQQPPEAAAPERLERLGNGIEALRLRCRRIHLVE